MFPQILWVGLLEWEDMLIRDLLAQTDQCIELHCNACLITTGEVYGHQNGDGAMTLEGRWVGGGMGYICW